MMEEIAERGFATAAQAVADGTIPGATLGVVAADGMQAVQVAEQQQETRASINQQTVGRLRRMKKAAIRRGEPMSEAA